MEQEHTPLFDDVRMGKLYNDTATPFLKKLYIVRDEYEADRREQAQRIEQLEAEVTRLTKKADTTMECAEILKGMLGAANDESERLQAEVARLSRRKQEER